MPCVKTVVHIYFEAIEAELRKQWVNSRGADAEQNCHRVMDEVNDGLIHLNITYGGYGSLVMSPHTFNQIMARVTSFLATKRCDGDIVYADLLVRRVAAEVEHHGRDHLCFVVVYNGEDDDDDDINEEEN
jgi:hypothetical protein